MFHLVVTKPGVEGGGEGGGRGYRAAVEGRVEPSLLGWSGVRQLRRVSLGSSQDRPAVAIAIQKGNAMCMFAGMTRALRAGAWVEEE